jgi:tRNA-specific 2-thiouridylase
MRCLALFAGGLDSLLSVRLMQGQGIEVVGVYAGNPLCAADGQSADQAAAQIGIELRTVDLAADYCSLLRAPRLGRIESVAPCLDCRIAMFAQARELLTQTNTRFVISGEVVGQRPRTAVRDLEVVAHHAGLSSLLVRPLSAHLLPPTEPEARGWVDRSRLAAIQGKSRKAQLDLARSLEISSIPPPRPDCPLLSQPLAGRVKEVLADAPPIDAWLLALLPIGRHTHVDERTRIIVGRNREENDTLQTAARQAEPGACSLVVPCGFPGPTALIVGPATPAACETATKLVFRYGRAAGSPEERVEIQRSSGKGSLSKPEEVNRGFRGGRG